MFFSARGTRHYWLKSLDMCAFALSSWTLRALVVLCASSTRMMRAMGFFGLLGAPSTVKFRAVWILGPPWAALQRTNRERDVHKRRGSDKSSSWISLGTRLCFRVTRIAASWNSSQKYVSTALCHLCRSSSEKKACEYQYQFIRLGSATSVYRCVWIILHGNGMYILVCIPINVILIHIAYIVNIT